MMSMSYWSLWYGLSRFSEMVSNMKIFGLTVEMLSHLKFPGGQREGVHWVVQNAQGEHHH